MKYQSISRVHVLYECDIKSGFVCSCTIGRRLGIIRVNRGIVISFFKSNYFDVKWELHRSTLERSYETRSSRRNFFVSLIYRTNNVNTDVYRRTAWEIYTSAATNVTLRLDCLQLLGFAVFARIILCPGCVLSGVVIATRVLFANRSIARETRAHRFSRYVILRIMLKADCVYFSFNCGLNSSKGIRGRDLRAPVSIRDR